MFKAIRDGERLVYTANPQAYNTIELERKIYDVKEGDAPELFFSVGEQDADEDIVLSLSQEQALELSRLLKEFGIRGQLPEPPQSEQNQPQAEESAG